MKSLMLFAVAAMGFTACQKEGVEESTNNSVAESTYTMTFVAGAPESRTSVEVDGTTANFSWAEEGETFTFVQNTADGLKKGTDVTFANNAGLAEITATFTDATSPIVAVYPEKAWASNENTNFNQAKLIVPSDQSILDGTFDPNADLLVSKVVTPEDANATHKLQFARLVAVGKMTLKNLPVVGTETIQKVNFSINSENALTGRLYIDLDTAEVSEWGYYGQKLNYVNLIDGNVTAAAENDFYFTCMPATVAAGEIFTVEVTTNAATYTHSVTIPEGKSIEFKSGRVAEFGVNMEDAERATIEGLPLPWSESFDSEDLSKYDITNGSGTTKVYPDDMLAGGTAGEILIAKEGGSMTATLASDGEAKTLNFWFKSNKTYIEVSSATEGVTINEVTGADNSYTVALAEGVRIFKITLTNNNSNARVDDIMLTEDAPTVEKITVTGATTSFTAGDEFVFGGTVNATYQNGATEDVTEDATVDSSEVDMDTAGTYTVTVKYNGLTTTYDVTIQAAGVQTETVTITFDGGAGQQDGLRWESSPITVVANKGNASYSPNENASDKALRFYAKNTLTISGTGVNITNVVFTFSTPRSLSASTGTYDNGTWNGSANSVIFTNTETSQAKIKSVAITYVDDNGSGDDNTGEGGNTGEGEGGNTGEGEGGNTSGGESATYTETFAGLTKNQSGYTSALNYTSTEVAINGSYINWTGECQQYVNSGAAKTVFGKNTGSYIQTTVTDGLSTLTINYSVPYSDNQVNFVLNINGTDVETKNVTGLSKGSTGSVVFTGLNYTGSTVIKIHQGTVSARSGITSIVWTNGN